MEPLRLCLIDRKGFQRDEWITEVLTPVIIRRFALEPAPPDGEHSVELGFARDRQDGDCVIYRELL